MLPRLFYLMGAVELCFPLVHSFFALRYPALGLQPFHLMLNTASYIYEHERLRIGL